MSCNGAETRGMDQERVFGVGDNLIPGLTGVEETAVAVRVNGMANEMVQHGPEGMENGLQR